MKFGQILEHTQQIAVELEKRFADDPKGELDCWVATAHRRESMVVEVYDALKLEQRIPDQPGSEAPAVAFVRDAVGSVWAQETSHARLMKSLGQLDSEHFDTDGPLGSIDGLMTSWATSAGLLGTIARGAIGAARVFKLAPPFTAALQSEPLLGFFRLSEELELTASNGYARIVELLETLDELGEPSGYGVVPEYEFATTLAEERFHRAVFATMQGWLKNERELDALDVREAARAIKRLADEHLAVKRVRRLNAASSESTRRFLESEGDALVSAGGLSDVFMRYGVDVALAKRPVDALDAA